MIFAMGFCYLFLGWLLYQQLRARKQHQYYIQQVKYLQKQVQDVAPIVNSVNLHCQNMERLAQGLNSQHHSKNQLPELQENVANLRKQIARLEQQMDDFGSQSDIALRVGTASDINPARQSGAGWNGAINMVGRNLSQSENISNFNAVAEDSMRRNLTWLNSPDLPL